MRRRWGRPAIAVELALAGAASIVIVNRDPGARAELVALVNEKMNISADSVIWNTQYRVPAATSIEVNATSIGLYPDSKGRLDIDLDTVEPHMIVADVIPNPPRTTLIRDADARGASVSTGLAYWSTRASSASGTGPASMPTLPACATRSRLCSTP